MIVKFMKRAEVCACLGWARSTLYDKIRAGLFLAPIKTGKRSSVWTAAEVSTIQAAMIRGSKSNQLRELVTQLTHARDIYDV